MILITFRPPEVEDGRSLPAERRGVVAAGKVSSGVNYQTWPVYHIRRFEWQGVERVLAELSDEMGFLAEELIAVS